MSFDTTPKTIHVSPETTAGSKVATVKMLIDTVVLNNASRLYLSLMLSNIQHNISGRLLPRFYNTHPLFTLLPSNKSLSSTFYYLNYLRYDSTAVAKLRELLPVYCTVDSKSYIAFSVDMYLLSNALLHLGDHSIFIESEVLANNSVYKQLTILKLRVTAGIIL